MSIAIHKGKLFSPWYCFSCEIRQPASACYYEINLHNQAAEPTSTWLLCSTCMLIMKRIINDSIFPNNENLEATNSSRFDNIEIE